jgi:hypothetical protein
MFALSESCSYGTARVAARASRGTPENRHLQTLRLEYLNNVEVEPTDVLTASVLAGNVLI